MTKSKERDKRCEKHDTSSKFEKHPCIVILIRAPHSQNNDKYESNWLTYFKSRKNIAVLTHLFKNIKKIKETRKNIFSLSIVLKTVLTKHHTGTYRI